MSIEKLIAELTDEVVSLRKVMQVNVDLMTALTEKTAAATGVAGEKAAPKPRASRAKAKDDAPAADDKEKETESRGREREDDRGDRSRDRDDDRGRDRDDERGSRSRADDDKGSRGRDKEDDDRDRGSGRDRAPSKSTDPYELIRDFLSYGEQDNKEDEDERDRRTDFLDDIFKFLEVKRAKDVPEKEGKNLVRWFRLFEDGKRVDFDRD